MPFRWLSLRVDFLTLKFNKNAPQNMSSLGDTIWWSSSNGDTFKNCHQGFIERQVFRVILTMHTGTEHHVANARPSKTKRNDLMVFRFGEYNINCQFRWRSVDGCTFARTSSTPSVGSPDERCIDWVRKKTLSCAVVELTKTERLLQITAKRWDIEPQFHEVIGGVFDWSNFWPLALTPH